MKTLQIYSYLVDFYHHYTLYAQNISFQFTNLYRAIDVHSLVGYMGGYVGLLLGVSILQIPKLLWKMFVNVKKLYGDTKE